MKDVLVQFTKNIKEERKRGDVAEKHISDTAKQMPPLELKGLVFTYFLAEPYDQLDFFDRIDDVIIGSFNCVEMRRVLVEQEKLKKKRQRLGKAFVHHECEGRFADLFLSLMEVEDVTDRFRGRGYG